MAVILGAIRFTVLEVTSGVVVLGILIAVCGSTLVGEDRRSHKHRCRQQRQEQHQSSQLILLPKESPYYFPTVRAKNLLSIRARQPATSANTTTLARDQDWPHHSIAVFITILFANFHEKAHFVKADLAA